MWAGPPQYDGVYDVDDSVTALIRTEGPVFTVTGAWAQNIDEDDKYIDFMGDKGGIRLQYGGDFTLYTVEHGALVKYTPELQTKTCLRQRSIRLSAACAPARSCRRISTPLC